MKAVVRIVRRWIMIPAALGLALGTVLTTAGPAGASTGQCGQNIGFAFLGGGEPHCLQGIGTYTFGSGQDPFSYVVNNTGFRVWFHQNADNSGWADCFNHGNAFGIANGRDAKPGNVQVTNNPAPCTVGNQGSAYCSVNAAFAWLVLPGNCYHEGDNVNGPGEPSSELTNGTGFRVWFHQYANGTGWADCFSNNNAYALTGRDQNPGNVYVSSNSAPC